MRKIKGSDILAAMTDIARENPNYIYQFDREIGVCSYFDSQGKASCLVGRALERQGLDDRQREFIKTFNTRAFSSLVYFANHEKDSPLSFDLTPDESNLICKIQNAQDGGLQTWPQCLETESYVI